MICVYHKNNKYKKERIKERDLNYYFFPSSFNSLIVEIIYKLYLHKSILIKINLNLIENSALSFSLFSSYFTLKLHHHFFILFLLIFKYITLCMYIYIRINYLINLF